MWQILPLLPIHAHGRQYDPILLRRKHLRGSHFAKVTCQQRPRTFRRRPVLRRPTRSWGGGRQRRTPSFGDTLLLVSTFTSAPYLCTRSDVRIGRSGVSLDSRTSADPGQSCLSGVEGGRPDGETVQGTTLKVGRSRVRGNGPSRRTAGGHSGRWQQCWVIFKGLRALEGPLTLV